MVRTDPTEQAKDTKTVTTQLVALLQRAPATRTEISAYFGFNRRRASTILTVLKVVIKKIKIPLIIIIIIIR
jgi:iron only hydrogenase large subunit-like protein